MLVNLFHKIKSRLVNGDARSVAVKKNIVASFALKGISMMVSFLLVPATIGYVSSELYGVWLTLSAVLTWIQFLDIGLTSGLKNKLTEAIAVKDYRRAKSLVSTTYLMMALIFLPISVIGCFFMPYIDWAGLLNVSAQYDSQIVEVMQLLIFMVSVQMVVNVVVSVVAAYQKVAMSHLFMVLGNVLSYILILILIHTVPASLAVLAVVLAGSPIVVTIIGSVVLYFGKFRAVAPGWRYIDMGCVRDLFTLGVKFFIINVQVVVVFQTTNLLISHVSSPEAVTSYNIAYKYLSLAMLLYTNITLPLWPAYTDAYAKGDKAWMLNMRRKMVRVLMLCAGLCVVFALISAPVYRIWIDGKAEVPTAMTWMVAAYVIVYCMMNLFGTFIVGIGKVYVETIVVLVGMVVYIPMALGLAKYFSEYGVVLALIILNFVYALFFIYQSNLLLHGKAKGVWDK